MRAIETHIEENLAPISALLWQNRISHRIFEERGRQVLELRDASDAERARALVAAWRDGRLSSLPVAHRPVAGSAGGLASLAAGLRRYPSLSLLIAVSIAVFPFSLTTDSGGPDAVTALLLFVAPGAAVTTGWFPAGAEIWRLVTPIFLHFSIMHLAFNSVIVIELGRRLEGGLGSGGFLLAVILLAMASNVGQWVMTGSPLFGGLSGVAYGLLGVVLALGRRVPDEQRFRLPQGVAVGLLGFLVFFSTGITEPFGLFVANSAHWTGLGAGLLLGLIWPAGARSR